MKNVNYRFSARLSAAISSLCHSRFRVRKLRIPLDASNVVCATISGIFLWLALGTSSLSAQNGIPTFGITPTGGYSTSPIDSVDLDTGNLIVTIPLLSYEQRGSLKPFTLYARYNTANWAYTQDQYQYILCGIDILLGFTIANAPSTTTAFDNYWTFIGGGMQIVRGDALQSGTYDMPLEGTNGEPVDYYVDYVQDGSGTQHLMYTTSGSGRAMDGSGLATVPTGVADGNGNTHSGVADRTFQGFQDTITDAHGNGITPVVIQGQYGVTQPSVDHWIDSVGRTIPAPPNNNPNITPGCYTYQYPSTNGGTAPYTFCYSNVPISGTFPITRTGQSWYFDNGPLNTLTSIQLPNGTAYTFGFDAWGDLQSIGLPTGGSITYTWVTAGQNQNAARVLTQRTVYPGDGTSRTWNYCFGNGLPQCSYLPQGITSTSSMVDPDGNETLRSYTGANPSNSQAATTTTTKFQGRASSGIVLQSVTETDCNYTGGVFFRSPLGEPQLPCKTDTTLSDGETYETTTTYDTPILVSDGGISNGSFVPTGTPAYKSIGVPVAQTVSAYGTGTPGAVVKSTTTSYLWQTQPAYLAANFMNLVSGTSTFDGSGNLIAQTSYGYDESNGSPQGILGDRTSTTSTVSSNNSQTVKTTSVYNSQGMVTDTYDANLNAGLPGNHIHIAYDSTGLYHSTVTQSPTSGINHVDSYGYDSNTGNLNWHTDQNGIAAQDPNHTTVFSYDSLGRMTRTQYPDGGNVQVSFNGDPSPPKVTVTTALGTGYGPQVSTQLYNGLGEVTQTQKSDPAGVVYQDLGYEAMGRVAWQSNPYRTTQDSTFGYTSFAYDGLGRKTYQCQPDNGSGNGSCVSGKSYQQWLYSGSTTTFYDENRNVWTQQADSLGHLASVTEPGGLKTSYTYDGNGNLLTVNQIGNPAVGDVPRVRAFSYDMLSRLTNACNPENLAVGFGPCTTTGGGPWSTSYLYDPDGDVLSKSNGSGTVSYCYDALSRLISKGYSGTAQPCTSKSPDVSYTYDTSSLPNAANAIGRLTSESTFSSGQTVSTRAPYLYDVMGRVKGIQECIFPNCNSATYEIGGSAPYEFDYTYDLAGNTLTSTNGLPAPTPAAPSPNYAQLINVYDGAGRLANVTSSWRDGTSHPATLFQATGYNPAGGLTNASLGLLQPGAQPSVSLVRGYDNRLRVDSEVDTTNSSQIQPATYATGSITLTGTNDQQLTQSATPGTGNIIVLGSEGNNSVCTGGGLGTLAVTQSISVNNQCKLIPDTGSLVITIYGPTTFTATVPYGATSTEAKLANAIANALGTASSPVAASPVTASWTSGTNVVQFTSKATGPLSNYQFSVDTNSNGNTDDFYGSDSGAMTGGAAGGTFYDSGTMSVSVYGGPTLSVTWQAGSSVSSLLSSLQNALAPYANLLQISPTSTGLNLTATQSGTGGDLNLACSQTDTSGQFPSPSFTISCSGLSGGVNAVYAPTTAYSYSIANSSGIPGTGYAPNGNVNSVTDSVIGSWNYNYDNLNRLTSTTGVSGNYLLGASAIPVSPSISMNWFYDSFGNRLGQTSNSPNLPTSWQCYAGSTNPLATCSNGASNTPTNRITMAQSQGSAGATGIPVTYSYDAAGNVTSDGYNTLTYDAEGKVCAVSNVLHGTTQYLYDAEGQRVASIANGSVSCTLPSGASPTTTFLRGAGDEMVTELGSGGTWTYSNVFAAGQLLATYRGNETYFALNDWLGTKRVVVTPDGQVQTYASLPFGDFLSPPNSVNDPSEDHFTGKERDSESGLDYFGSRYYGSSMGRWTSPDPSGLAYADPTNPQSLNLYSYVLNNPLKLFDPTGMAYCKWDDGTHDDSANTGVDGAVNSGTECTSAGGTWSHDDGLNDDGSTIGSEGKPAFTVTASLDTTTDQTIVTTSGPYYDPQEVYNYMLLQDIAQDTAGFPTVCSVGAYAQVGAGPVAGGYSYDSSKGGNFYSTVRATPGDPGSMPSIAPRNNGSIPMGSASPFSGTVKRTASGSYSGSATVRDPVTGVGGGVSVNEKGTPTVSASWRPNWLGRLFTVGATATLGTIGNPACQMGPVHR